jgi:MFS family permease
MGLGLTLQTRPLMLAASCTSSIHLSPASPGLALALVLGTTACVGTWSVVVVLPAVQAEYGSLRAGASMPYAAAMIGFAGGTLSMGRVADRYGVAALIAVASVCLFVGYELAAFLNTLGQFTLVHLLIGFGAAAGFGPGRHRAYLRGADPRLPAAARSGGPHRVVLTATIVGMAFGGYLPGAIFDLLGHIGLRF